MEDNYDYLLKVLLIGDSSVGKTSVLLRYTDKCFTPQFQTTIGVDFRLSTFQIQGKLVKLQLWDTAGQERYRRIVSSYYRGSHGLIIVYDVANRESFNNVTHWLEESNSITDTVPKLLIGNKIDLKEQRKVSTDEGKELAEQLGMDFLETSAKNNENIEEAFIRLTNKMLEKKLVIEKNEAKRIGPMGRLDVKPRGWCCV